MNFDKEIQEITESVTPQHIDSLKKIIKRDLENVNDFMNLCKISSLISEFKQDELFRLNHPEFYEYLHTIHEKCDKYFEERGNKHGNGYKKEA